MSILRSVSALLLLPLLAFAFVPIPSRQPTSSHQPWTSTTSLKDCEYPWEGKNFNDENLIKFSEEETLLQIHLKPMHDTPLKQVAIPRVRKYVQEFLFQQVLPVQKLQTLATEDGGAEVIFWKDQSQADGGMRFFIVPGEEGVEIVVKRESEGQTLTKNTTEKLVVQAFLKAFTGKDHDRKFAKDDPPTHDVVTMESVFHKWMFSA